MSRIMKWLPILLLVLSSCNLNFDNEAKKIARTIEIKGYEYVISGYRMAISGDEVRRIVREELDRKETPISDISGYNKFSEIDSTWTEILRKNGDYTTAEISYVIDEIHGEGSFKWFIEEWWSRKKRVATLKVDELLKELR